MHKQYYGINISEKYKCTTCTNNIMVLIYQKNVNAQHAQTILLNYCNISKRYKCTTCTKNINIFEFIYQKNINAQHAQMLHINCTACTNNIYINKLNNLKMLNAQHAQTILIFFNSYIEKYKCTRCNFF